MRANASFDTVSVEAGEKVVYTDTQVHTQVQLFVQGFSD